MKYYELYNGLVVNKGFTLNTDLEHLKVKSGYFVGGLNRVYKKDINKLSIYKFKKVLNKYKNKAIKNGLYIGGWVDNNIIYLELSKHYNDKNEALLYASLKNELAIYDIKNSKSIYLKDINIKDL